MPQERVRFEADALREQARLCPEHVPELFHFDAQLCLLVMQYLPPPHDVARRALTAGRIYPKLAQHMATFMARTLFGTSLFALDAKTWRYAALTLITTCSQIWCSCVSFIQRLYEEHCALYSPLIFQVGLKLLVQLANLG